MYAHDTGHGVACSRTQRRTRAFAARREIVQRAEDYTRAHLDSPVPLARLCRVLGVSERALRNAFYGVRGMSPRRCMLADRLQCVRRALSATGSRPNTVTSVATDFGFYQLGRFAAIYKETFGEAPSETLRGTRRKTAAS
jgi:AraC family ethanolamine operon transcriptional activator